MREIELKLLITKTPSVMKELFSKHDPHIFNAAMWKLSSIEMDDETQSGTQFCDVSIFAK